MEADRVAAAFQHGAFQIVVEQNARHAVPGGERADVAAQEVLHPGVEVKAQKDLARVAEHHDERHQRTVRTADLQRTEMPPVHLTLFTRQAAQAQECFRRAAGAMLGDDMAEVVGATSVAALNGGQPRPHQWQCGSGGRSPAATDTSSRTAAIATGLSRSLVAGAGEP